MKPECRADGKDLPSWPKLLKEISVKQTENMFNLSKHALHSNVPSNLVPSTLFEHFRGERGCPGTVHLHTLGSTSQQGPCDTNVPSRLVPGTLLWTYFGVFLGHRGGTRVAPGTVSLRDPKGTLRNACWKALNIFNLFNL